MPTASKPGDTVLIHAGAGGVGLLLTQIAKLKGARVITTVSTQEKAALSRAAGADEVLIGYDGFADRVRDLTGGKGVAAVYDGVGKSTFDGSLDVAAGARDHGAVRWGQRPGAAVRRPAAQQGWVAEAHPAECRSLRHRA